MENLRNQDQIGEKELLVVSFGTSFPATRAATIGAIEERIASAFPDYSVRRAFTSSIILRKLSREGICIDSVPQALDRAKANGVQHLLVQPTHMMDGIEYHKLLALVEQHKSDFASVSVGAPLLSGEADFHAVIEAIAQDTKEFDDGKTAIVLMGHGSEAQSNAVYAKFQKMLTDKGYVNHFVATVEATPTLEDVIRDVTQVGYSRVVLQPLMVVAGDHATNDMAGDGEDSWKSAFVRASFSVECVLKGLGQLSSVQDIYVRHVSELLKSQNEPLY